MKPVSIPVPSTIGPYRVIRPLAQGGMAAVFEVENPTTRERLALKLLTHRGLAEPRFRQEYMALTRLDHPNIVRVYDFGVDDGRPYLTMELLDGVPVQVYAKSLGRPGQADRTREVLRVVAEIAEALAYLHERGIVHRDLKSANVLVLSDRRVKLLDFGTARFLYGARGITRQGEFVGTFAYASPEQIQGESLDGRADLYSLGALFYRLCTGKRVFTAESPHELARMHVTQAPVPPHERVPALPQPVSELILRMLEKDRARRPASAHEIVERIRGRRQREAAELVPGAARLIGREQERASLQATLAKARPGRMVLLLGPSGSGRHRLLRAGTEDAQARGCRICGGRFGQSVGLDALSEVAARIFASLEEPLPPALKRWEHVDAPIDERAPVFEAIADALVRRQRADGVPLVLWLGGLQRASPMALDALSLIRQRARSAGAPILTLCTALEGADAPGGPLRTRFPDAWRLELGPIGSELVGELVGGLLGGREVNPELARRIHRATGGLPGFVEEVVRAMIQEGHLAVRPIRGRLGWVELSDERLVIPGSVREAISLRLSALPPLARRAAEALAVVGGDAPAPLLAAGLEKGEAETRAALDELVARRLASRREVMGEARWDFRLGLTRELVLEQTRRSRAFVLRRWLATAMLDQPPSASKILVLQSADRIDEAVEAALIWAAPLIEDQRAAEVLFTLQELSEFVERVGASEPRAHFYLLLGRALSAVRPGDPLVRRSFDRAAEVARSESLRGEIELYDARERIGRGDLVAAQLLLDQASVRLEGGSDQLQALAAFDRGALHWYAGEFERAGVCFERSLQAARRAGLPRETARALTSRAVTRLAAGDLKSAEQELREACEGYEAAGDQDGQWHALTNLAEVLRLRACFTEALGLLLPELGTAREVASVSRYALMVLNLAEIDVELFRLGRARQRLDALEAWLGDIDHLFIRVVLGLGRAKVALAAGEPEAAAELLPPLLARAEAAELNGLSAHVRAFLGEARLRIGDVERGRADIEAATARLQELGHLPPLAEACAARARAEGHQLDPDLLFAPVIGWMQAEGAWLLTLQHRLASIRYAQACNQRQRVLLHARSADELYRKILAAQAPEERAALEVHPWRQAIQRALGE